MSPEVEVVDPRRRKEVRRWAGIERAEGLPYVPTQRAELRRRAGGRSALRASWEEALVLGDRARCLVTVRPEHQAKLGEAVGGIGHLWAADVASAVTLLDDACARLAAQGCTTAIAPYDHFLNAQAQWAVDELPAFPRTGGSPVVRESLETAGFARRWPWLTYRIPLDDPSRFDVPVPEGATIRRVRRAAWWRELAVLAEVLDEAFEPEWEHHPFEAPAMREVFGPLLALVDPRQFLIAELDGRAVGLCLGTGDLGSQLQAAAGGAGLRDGLRLLRAKRRPARAGVFMVGVTEAGRGRGIGRALAAQVLRRAVELGATEGIYHLVNEHNRASRALAESLGGTGRVVAHHWARAL
ncbi:GNAT family N-acetyltransferase [Conexibacter sp. SYSU D00693]|uniref:GNAT family N-acetyltransferase n=1 Tax=Conexibacter sp. SYSU D00693 TaxID=2812560 RepID=UPI00196B5C33|nr:GNAT family N-acetyltransferase [Conexibacter sp. SYSU D00693]